jgi:hypothetical protein
MIRGSGRLHAYALYGVTLHSTRPLPGLLPGRDDGDAIGIDFVGPTGSDPDTPPFWTNGWETFWHLDADTWLLAYRAPGVDAHHWTVRYDGGSRITVRWDTDALLKDIPAVLQGPGIAPSLHLRGVPLLHGCVVDIGGRAVVVMGAPGAGKSTAAAALVRAGCPLVSDDVAAMSVGNDDILVQAGYPQLRLFADSATAAGWDPLRLSRAFDTPLLADKLYVQLDAGHFRADALPVHAIYMLQPRRAGSGNPIVTMVDRGEAWRILAGNIYAFRFLDAERRFRCVRDCAVIAARVPVRLVQAADDLGALPRLLDVLTARET